MRGPHWLAKKDANRGCGYGRCADSRQNTKATLRDARLAAGCVDAVCLQLSKKQKHAESVANRLSEPRPVSQQLSTPRCEITPTK